MYLFIFLTVATGGIDSIAQLIVFGVIVHLVFCRWYILVYYFTMSEATGAVHLFICICISYCCILLFLAFKMLYFVSIVFVIVAVWYLPLRRQNCVSRSSSSRQFTVA